MAAIVQQKGGEEAALVVQFEQMVRNGEADLQAHPEGQGKCRVWQRHAPAVVECGITMWYNYSLSAVFAGASTATRAPCALLHLP